MAIFGFFIFLSVWMYCSHLQFMAGYDNVFFARRR